MIKIVALVLAGLLFTAVPAAAMTGLEFLQLKAEYSQETGTGDAYARYHALLDRLVIGLVSRGYHNVPDWLELTLAIEELILKKGYRDKDIEEIAEEAARAHGMRK